jgi:transposase-like protein
MGSTVPTKRRRRREYSPEFKAEAVKLAQKGDRSVRAVADDLGIRQSVLHRWVQLAEQTPGGVSRAAPPVAQTSEALTAAERAELQQLRRENERLRMEREILKKAAAFFAKESE